MPHLYRDINLLPASRGRVVTLGSFDGLHLGHRALLKKLAEVASARSLDPLVVTFDPHPRSVISPDNHPQLLLTPEEETTMLGKVTPADTLVLPFNKAMQNMTAEEFVTRLLLEKMNMKALVAGENHAIGHNREGNTAALREMGSRYNFTLTTLAPVTCGGTIVSSSAIRRLIAEGDLPKANSLLGDRYRLSGEVIRGIGLGRKLGYPTANINYDKRKALPREGIYATHIDVAGVRYGGMLFVGRNHMDPAGSFSVEGNIFDFDADIYGDHITYLPVSLVRENRIISTREELIRQMAQDKEMVTAIIQQKEKSSVC